MLRHEVCLSGRHAVAFRAIHTMRDWDPLIASWDGGIPHEPCSNEELRSLRWSRERG